jgi:hypothetical protein
MEGVALDLMGNYTVQSLLEATHKLRGVAHTMAQQVRQGEAGTRVAYFCWFCVSW